MDEHNLEIRDDSKNTIINQYFIYKEAKQSKDYKVQFIKISSVNNLSSFILIKQNLKTLAKSKKSKKAKNFYSEVIFTGLRQPTKKINIKTYDVLSKFIKRFKVFDIDICFDGVSELAINQKKLHEYNWIFEDYISVSSDTKIYRTSFYINNPKSVESDTDRYKKLILYDKNVKESQNKPLDDSYKNWKRLEATIKVEYNLKGLMIDDYLLDVLMLASKHFDVNEFDINYIYLQLDFLMDRRTHKGKEFI